MAISLITYCSTRNQIIIYGIVRSSLGQTRLHNENTSTLRKRLDGGIKRFRCTLPVCVTARPANRGVVCCRHPANIGSSRRKPSMKWMREAKFIGRQTAIPAEKCIWMKAQEYQSKIFGSISKTHITRTLK